MSEAIIALALSESHHTWRGVPCTAGEPTLLAHVLYERLRTTVTLERFADEAVELAWRYVPSGWINRPEEEGGLTPREAEDHYHFDDGRDEPEDYCYSWRDDGADWAYVLDHRVGTLTLFVKTYPYGAFSEWDDTRWGTFPGYVWEYLIALRPQRDVEPIWSLLEAHGSHLRDHAARLARERVAAIASRAAQQASAARSASEHER